MSHTIQESIKSLVNSVNENPEKRTDIFTVKTHLAQGLHVKADTGNFQFEIDEPPVLGGTNKAPNPVEYLLAALGTCQSIVYRILALGHQIPVEELQINLKGYIDLRGFLGIKDDVRPGFNKIEAETIVTTDADAHKVARLYENVKRYCPVLDILSNTTPVTGKVNFKKSDYQEHEDTTPIKNALTALIDEIKQNPAAAHASFETVVHLEDRLTNLVNVRDFSFKVDKEESYGGHHVAANPLEYLLAALGACQSIVYKALAALKSIKLDEVNLTITGYLDVRGLLAIDDQVRPGYQKIEFNTELVSNEDPETLKRLAKQVEILCPVLDNLQNPLPVEAAHVIKTHSEATV